ncbi:hypothetical protein QP255_23920, partial [Escherichia coli]|nr:hypothetical protein [Escherichia coli]
AGTECCATHERKWHVSAERRCQLVQRLSRKRLAVISHERVRGDQCSGSVGGTARHPASDEDVLGHLDVNLRKGDPGTLSNCV